jgi:hypothetical protein
MPDLPSGTVTFLFTDFEVGAALPLGWFSVMPHAHGSA